MANTATRHSTVHHAQERGLEVRWPASIIWRDTDPAIRRITTADVWQSLREGFDDFIAMPTHLVFAALIYPVIGLILARVLFGYGLLSLIYPLAAGFALLGPFLAIGLYELSRRREAGLDVVPTDALEVIHRPGMGGIFVLGLGLAAVFVAWLYAANLMYTQIMGGEPASVSAFVHDVLKTTKGHNLAIAGNLVGFLFALFVLVTSVVSFPMLVDRKVSVGTAVRTSIRASVENPGPIALWGLIVAAGLVLGAIPLLVGLAITLPILGHATWHLYRKLVVPPEQQDISDDEIPADL
ncbi:DUF2189 domain-containing protein [Hyphomicrobium sp.]|uniref:DUF2189 domain-containing protein n=1 Tax=Hyphomicrobium sp. TaxID=82 RepID=UPI002D77254F|nr:DUF2189 domain-containing protein [Hyphomicrobium sp.]HET6388460.1 DUF2189 domain-containing protein [Hyphomicrobium sp.]